MIEQTQKMRNYTFYVFSYWHEPRYKGVVDAVNKVFDLCANLTRLEHNVVLFVPGCGINKHSLPYEIIQVPYISCPGLRSVSYFLASFLMALFKSLIQKPDIIYFRWMHSFLPVLLAKLRRSRIILEINDDFLAYYDRCESRSLKLYIFKLIDFINIKCADAISVITENLKERIKNKYRIPGEKLVVIPSCSNVDLFKPMDSTHCRTKLHINDHEKYIGFIGALLEWKGVATLLEAAPIVLEKHPDTGFLVVGEGHMKDELISQARALQVENKFLFTGQVPYSEVPSYISIMDVCTAPYIASVGEISPVKIFDYLSCGKPVVASNNVGSLLLNSGAVLPVPPDDPKELAQAIIKLLDKSELRRTMGITGRKWVLENAKRENVARKIIEMVR